MSVSQKPTRIEDIDVCGGAALAEVEHRLQERGYRITGGGLSPGFYSFQPSDPAPGYAEWIYAVSVALRGGDELRGLLDGIV